MSRISHIPKELVMGSKKENVDTPNQSLEMFSYRYSDAFLAFRSLFRFYPVAAGFNACAAEEEHFITFSGPLGH